MQPKVLDHVAFWVADRDAVGSTLVSRLGIREIDRQESFTLLGADALHFKLTLFDAEGPRDPGAFVHIALRASRLPGGAPVTFTAGEGLHVTVVEAETEVDYDLDHVALRSIDPRATAAEYERFGFKPAGPGRVEVSGAYVEFRPGPTRPTDRPLLNHLAVRVDSVEDVIAGAEELGIGVESVVDAPNTYAAFLPGPDGVRIEYVEHKPSFSLV
jgi:catechol 2,3-dioxygenase-like lactoylglutathione lyase family enzyme